VFGPPTADGCGEALHASAHAAAVIGTRLRVAPGRFRRLNAPEWLQEVSDGATVVNGGRVMERAWEVAA